MFRVVSFVATAAVLSHKTISSFLHASFMSIFYLSTASSLSKSFTWWWLQFLKKGRKNIMNRRNSCLTVYYILSRLLLLLDHECVLVMCKPLHLHFLILLLIVRTKHFKEIMTSFNWGVKKRKVKDN